MKRADPLLEQVSRMLGRYLPGDARHIVVALSGGADSVCLLHALLSLKPLHGCTLSAVHLNHLLRGQAAFEDAAFVEALCQRLGVELLSEQADVAALSRQRHIGEELAGRQARYDLFEKAAARYDGAVVATAHTASDQAETLLLHLLRGSRLDGLAGIPPQRPGYLRPLLLCTRRQVGRLLRPQQSVLCDGRLQPAARLPQEPHPPFAAPRTRARLQPKPHKNAFAHRAAAARGAAASQRVGQIPCPPPFCRKRAGSFLTALRCGRPRPLLARRHLRRQAASSFGVTPSAAQSQEASGAGAAGAKRQPGAAPPSPACAGAGRPAFPFSAS